jgi:SAM-dependent methyltransferase
VVPALDVGCGTGRLLLDYMQQGLDVDGMDNSPEMLSILRQKAAALGLTPQVYLQTMETLDLPRRYRVILVPSSSFQLLAEPAAAAEALRRFHAHLEPGGVLVMSLFVLGVDEHGQPIPEDESTTEVTRPEDGALIRRWSRSVYDHANQLEDTEDRYDVIVDGVVVASEQRSRARATPRLQPGSVHPAHASGRLRRRPPDQRLQLHTCCARGYAVLYLRRAPVMG